MVAPGLLWRNDQLANGFTNSGGREGGVRVR